MLRKHAKFFDLNNDDILTSDEIYQGLVSLRINPFVSFLGSLFLPLFLGVGSGGDLTKIRLDGIENLIHSPNDTGGFVKDYNTIITNDFYTKEDIKKLINDNGGNADTLAFSLEWDLLFDVMNKFRELKNDSGVDVLSKQELKDLFSGDLFYKLTNK